MYVLVLRCKGVLRCMSVLFCILLAGVQDRKSDTWLVSALEERYLWLWFILGFIFVLCILYLGIYIFDLYPLCLVYPFFPCILYLLYIFFFSLFFTFYHSSFIVIYPYFLRNILYHPSILSPSFTLYLWFIHIYQIFHTFLALYYYLWFSSYL